MVAGGRSFLPWLWFLLECYNPHMEKRFYLAWDDAISKEDFARMLSGELQIGKLDQDWAVNYPPLKWLASDFCVPAYL